MSEKIDVVMPDGTKQRVQRVAAHLGRKPSEFVRDAVLEALAPDSPKYASGNREWHDMLELILSSPRLAESIKLQLRYAMRELDTSAAAETSRKLV